MEQEAEERGREGGGEGKIGVGRNERGRGRKGEGGSGKEEVMFLVCFQVHREKKPFTVPA